MQTTEMANDQRHRLSNRRGAQSMTSAGSFSAAKEGWLKLVASYPNLSGADVAVAVMLSTYMNTKSRDAWPSMETLARDTNRSRSTVWRSLKRLEKLKLLAITHAR